MSGGIWLFFCFWAYLKIPKHSLTNGRAFQGPHKFAVEPSFKFHSFPHFYPISIFKTYYGNCVATERAIAIKILNEDFGNVAREAIGRR